MMREFGALRQALCCVNLVRFAKRKKNKLYPHISCSTISHEVNGCHAKYQPKKREILHDLKLLPIDRMMFLF